MITCDPKLNAYVRDDGSVVPRVSSICRLLDPDCFAHVSDSAMATASRRGTWVHDGVDRYHTAGHWECGINDIDDIVAPYILAPGYLEFLSDMDAEPLEGEKVVSHRLYGYAGRLDKIYQVRGRRTVVDFKSGPIPKSVYVALSGYQEAYNDSVRAEHPTDWQGRMVTDRAALRLRPGEKYQFRRPLFPFPEDLRLFLALLTVLRGKEMYAVAESKPKF